MTNQKPLPIGVGVQYNYLTALRPSTKTQGKNKMWEFQCVCGTVKTLQVAAVRYEGTKSCGCQRLRLNGASNVTHGMKKSPEYNVWRGVKERCLNPNSKDYYRYSCRAPLGDFSFEAFYAAVGPRPGPEYSIDRIDNNGTYDVGNLRWALLETQANNRKDNILVCYQGQTMSLAKACREAGISYGKALQRFKVRQDINHASDGLFTLVSAGRYKVPSNG